MYENRILTKLKKRLGNPDNFSQDIRMEFDSEKYIILLRKKKLDVVGWWWWGNHIKN